MTPNQHSNADAPPVARATDGSGLPALAGDKSVFENPGMESRLQAAGRGNRLKAGLHTPNAARPATFQTRSKETGKGKSSGGWWFILLMVAGLFLAITQTARTQGKPVGEHELKAAFISKFPLFVTWPDTSFAASNSPIVIGVLGKNSVGPYLEVILRGKAVDQHPLQLRVCGSVEEAATCQMVFIAESEEGSLDEILKLLEHQNILTISDLPDFAARGGMLGLGEAGRKIRLEVNLTALQNSGLRVDPKLLQLARVIRPAARTIAP